NRCTYCILDYEAREMTTDTARAMDEFYMDTINYRRPFSVRDDYLGGEPLLNTGVLLASAARRFNHCRNKNIDYGFTITTNGVLLTRAIVSKMKAVGLAGIRVSLAGPARVHDPLRPSATQGKTYDTIIRNLKSVSGMTPIAIECQYDSGSTDFRLMPEMYDDFKKHNIVIDDIHFTPILKKRGECRFNTGLGDPKIALDLIKEARTFGYASEREAPASLCRADFKAMFVFDTDGSIIPCPGLQEGEMAYGHVTKGVDFIAESQLLKRNLPDKCLNHCDLLPLCMGGCRQQALVYWGDFAGIDCQYDTQRLFLDDYIREMALGALSQEEGAQEEMAYEGNPCMEKAA
ncbi:MAG: SPASM domain-containing protein, partial [Desulfosalsimonadaceae bacterium]|nr:SPASM domain-containing protein [Desulfosalsimonadaceae bacterium]